jgi:cephalosporin-C deacetylase-like acetyl esterase
MGAIWLDSWFGQSVTGWSVYNADQIQHMQPTVNWLGYISTADFWEGTLQNWQSEFLAVGSMAIFSVYLRQRGSSQSKPVGAPHHATAEEG